MARSTARTYVPMPVFTGKTSWAGERLARINQPSGY
jgi:hypothetical protein